MAMPPPGPEPGPAALPPPALLWLPACPQCHRPNPENRKRCLGCGYVYPQNTAPRGPRALALAQNLPPPVPLSIQSIRSFGVTLLGTILLYVGGMLLTGTVFAGADNIAGLARAGAYFGPPLLAVILAGLFNWRRNRAAALGLFCGMSIVFFGTPIWLFINPKDRDILVYLLLGLLSQK